MKLQERLRLIRRSISLLIEEGSIAELRIPKSERGPQCGLFFDLDAAARAAARYSGTAPGIFVGLNPVRRSFAGGVTNSLAKVSSTIRDTDVQCRRWLPIDFDPVRPSNTPSTDAEHAGAIALAKECRSWLNREGWPDPVLADSGNGSHLLYRIDLPNDEPSRDLVKNIFEAISLRFSHSTVLVDTGNFNASRIWRIPGTFNCKGEKTEDRPHRRAKVLEVPDEIEVVSRKQLREIASTLPVPTDSGRKEKKEDVDLAGWITEHNVPVVSDAPWNHGGHKWVLSQCPWDESHTNRSAYIVRFPDGNVAAGCLHKSCAGRNWPALRSQFEQRTPSQPESASPQGNSLSRKAKRTDLLLELNDRIEVFCTPQGDPYATVWVKDHNENHLVRSRAFDLFLRHQYYFVNKTAPRPQALHEAVAHFSAVAVFDSPKKPVSIRVAAAGDVNYLDLADDTWRSVEFDSDGWRIVKTPPVKFRRSPGMLPLPMPVRGGISMS